MKNGVKVDNKKKTSKFFEGFLICSDTVFTTISIKPFFFA
jgi:hypothetical protein